MHTDERGVGDEEGLLSSGGEERLLLVRPILLPLILLLVCLLRVGFLLAVVEVVGIDVRGEVVDYI